jgi:hypothetical protein
MKQGHYTYWRTRQDKTRQDKTRQDKTRQDKTRQDRYSLKILFYWLSREGSVHQKHTENLYFHLK